jgi:PPP family 3-phenylpropionic acid transporter
MIFIAFLALGFRSSIPLVDALTTITIGAAGNYGRIRTIGSISFILTVLFCQWTPVLRPNTAFNIASWIGITSALAVISTALIPARYTLSARSRPQAPETPASTMPAGGISGARRRMRRAVRSERKPGIWSPLFIMGLLMIALCRLAIAPHYSFLSLYLVEFMHWDAVGIVFAVSTTAEVPFMFISHRLIRRFGPLPLIAAAAAATGVRLGIYALFPFKPWIIAAQLLHSLCFGIFHPAAVAFISESVPPERRALGMSLYLSLGTGFPSFFGNILGGFIVEHSGFRVLFGSFTIFAVVAVVLFFFIPRSFREPPKAPPLL